MISIIDYARIAGQIYDLKKNPYFNLYTTLSDAKKAIYTNGWHIMKDVDETMVVTNHFFAQLYLKFENNIATDAVIGVRGTVFTDKYNIMDDILSWYSDALGTGNHDSAPLYYTSLLIIFVNKSYNYIRKHFPNISHIKFTGHSLGGALAQLMPLSAGFLGEAIVFNSPGVGNIPGVVKENAGWITNINSSYGIINKIGKRLGDLYSVDVPEMEPQAKQLYADMNLTDYKKSDQYYNLADTLDNNKITSAFTVPEQSLINYTGLAYRLKSYLSTYEKVNQQMDVCMQLLTIIFIILTLAGCSNNYPPPPPPNTGKYASEVNPEPKYFMTLQGYIDPQLKNKIPLKIIASYYTMNMDCYYYIDKFEGAASPRIIYKIINVEANNDGFYKCSIPLDAYQYA